MLCSICHKNIGMFASGKCADGKICKSCWNSIPEAFLLPEVDVSQLTSDKINALIEYRSEQEPPLRERFITSSSYGSFLLDAHHGLLYVGAPSQVKNGVIEGNSGTVLDLRYIRKISMSMEILKASETKVEVNVKGSLTTNALPVELINVPVKDDLALSILEGDHVKYYLPYGASMMQNEIIRINHELVDNAIHDKQAELFDMDNNNKNLKLLRAKSLYMLHGDYTEQEIKKTRNKLVKVFHPDEGDTDQIKVE